MATQAVVTQRVMAPSTLGTFLRAFTFGHIRQLDSVLAGALGRAWALGAGPGSGQVVVDLDSSICEVSGKNKQGAGYGYTNKLGYHPLLATRAATGEVLHVRMRKGAANQLTDEALGPPLGAMLGELTPDDQLVVARTVRTRFLSVPGCLVNRSGRPTLRAPFLWPWAEAFCRALDLLRSLPPVPV